MAESKWTAADIPDQTYDEQVWRRLLEVSEQLTGVHYDFEAPRVPA